MAPWSVHFGVRSRQLSNVGQSLDGCTKIYYLELRRASEGTLSRWSRLHLQSLAPMHLHWARVVGYAPVEGLCPSSGDINRLMMMMMMKRHLKLLPISFITRIHNMYLSLQKCIAAKSI
jgi:hypothetical protein